MGRRRRLRMGMGLLRVGRGGDDAKKVFEEKMACVLEELSY